MSKDSARAAIILAAGKGSRMKSELPKVLHPVNGKAMATFPIRRALALRCDPVVVVVGHQHERVRSELEAEFPEAPLRFVHQAEQLGTGHAVATARRALAGFDGRVLIVCGDVPLLTGPTLQRLMRAGRGRLVAGLSMRPEDPHGYGRVVRDESGQVMAVVEQKDLAPGQKEISECNAGIYDCDAKFLWKALRQLRTDNAQGEYYLTDIIAAAYEAGQPAAMIDAPEEDVMGVNDRVELARASRIQRQRVAIRHMQAGVTLLAPEATYIEEDVRIGADAVIEPNVALHGATRIGAGARIGFGSVIRSSRIAAGVEVKSYSVLEDAVVGENASVGPFARLRPGTRLGEGVRIGNFVETKNAQLGEGAKVNHLSYVGDAVVGKRSNVGAGTITCNYDGEKKHRTVLGDDVFVGSDSQLVAPVKVGDGAYVGAGSTVVEDVPAGALAVARSRQVVKEGWVASRKKKAAPAAKTARPAKAARTSRKKTKG